MGGSGKIESSSGGWGGEERGDGVGGQRAPFACFFFQFFFQSLYPALVSELKRVRALTKALCRTRASK
jgi:hypothetical protein